MGKVVRLPKSEVNVVAALEELADYITFLQDKNAALENENKMLKKASPNTKDLDALPDILTAQDIANYLRISRYTAYQYLKMSPEHGGIKSFETGRSVRCRKIDFVEWLELEQERKAHSVRKNMRGV